MAEFVVQELPGLGPVAVPQTTAELGRFLALQRAINAYVAKHSILGSHTIEEDGRLGPGTRQMYNLIAGFISGLEPARSITSLATYAEDSARTIAAAAGASYNASVPTKPPPTTKPGATLPPLKPPPTDKKSKTVWWVVGGLALTGLVITGVVIYRGRRGRGTTRRLVPA